MCTGGRIKQHLKHNVWRRECHILIVGFQAGGTLGRSLVDGAKNIRLWGETIKVAATIHTIGGLSAHADQRDLLKWIENFKSRPEIVLIHGEQESLTSLANTIQKNGCSDKPLIPVYGETLEL